MKDKEQPNRTEIHKGIKPAPGTPKNPSSQAMMSMCQDMKNCGMGYSQDLKKTMKRGGGK